MDEKEYRAAVRAARKAWFELSIRRGDDYVLTWIFNNIDYSASTFAAQIRLVPDASGDAVAHWTVGTPIFAGGNTTVTFALSKTETAALPAAREPGRNARFYSDFKKTTGGQVRSFAAGALNIFGRITP
jgi:hypothetical protein